MDTLQVALRLTQPQCFWASIDLKEAYYSVPVGNSSRKYLRFLYKDCLFQYTYLPNGLASAPRIFTKILKPVLSELRKKGISCLIYIDDFLIQASTKEECLYAV